MEIEKLQEEYKKLYPEIEKIYGISVRKSDNRTIVSMRLVNGKALTKQYAKVLLELKLNRRLGKNETIDHIDGDKNNDSVDNIQLLSREDNAAKGAVRVKPIVVNCIYCSTPFQLSKNQIKNRNSKYHKHKAGPFCSRTCSGKYGAELQNNRMDPLQRPEYSVDYYRMQDTYFMKTIDDAKTLQDLKELGITGIFPGTNPNVTETEVVTEIIKVYKEAEEAFKNGTLEEAVFDD